MGAIHVTAQDVPEAKRHQEEDQRVDFRSARRTASLSSYFVADRRRSRRVLRSRPIFQLPVKPGPSADFYTRAPLLFDESANHDALAARIKAGTKVAVAPTETAGIPMFVHTPAKHLHIAVAGDRPTLETGQELIGLIERT